MITIQKEKLFETIWLLVLDMNTWNHIAACKLFVLDRNTWYHFAESSGCCG